MPGPPTVSDTSAPAATGRMLVVHRDEIPTLRSVEIDGVEHNLGILKDFRRHPALAELIPESARLAMAWVRLEPGETLEPHVHPIASMIVVAQGAGRTLGDLEADFAGGDVIAIPGGCHHGFVGAGADGFWALSIQFEERGLYERPDDPLVAFDERERAAGLDLLLRRNAELCARHRENPMFALVADGRLDDPRVRQRYLACVQTWSNWFQRTILLRSGVVHDERYLGLFRDHLDEEFGHDRLLAGERGTDERVWDPVLEAASSWFASSMLMADDADKAVLVHLVLEAAGATFMAIARPVLNSYGETTYFDVHDEADDQHAAMAERALEGLSEETYRRLLTVQDQGWQMFETLCARMAELSVDGDGG